MSFPKISAIVPLYNHEKYIASAIQSLLNQTYKDFEIIVIDDGSTDKSAAVVNNIHDDRMRYVYQKNRGAHNAINRGIRLAKGEYISILNSDDTYKPQRFHKLLESIETNKSIQAVFSYLEMIDEDDGFIEYKQGCDLNILDVKYPKNMRKQNSVFLDLLAENIFFTTSNLFFRKTVIEEIGEFRNYRYVHDYDFFLRLCYYCKVYVAKEKLVHYRIHKENTIKKNEAETTFELGLVLSDALVSYDIEKYYQNADIYEILTDLFICINSHHMDRMIFLLLLFVIKGKLPQNAYYELTTNSENLFRKTCISYSEEYISVWNSSQNAWKKCDELNDRLIEKDKQLADALNETKFWWQESQKAWEKWQKNNGLIIELDKKLAIAKEETADWWKESQKAWLKYNELCEQLVNLDAKFSDYIQKAEKRYNELETHMKEIMYEKEKVLSSKTYRIGRIVTWPARKIKKMRLILKRDVLKNGCKK